MIMRDILGRWKFGAFSFFEHFDSCMPLTDLSANER